jgi:spore maturation protein CgeB
VRTVLLVAGTQVTTSDLHLLYERAFAAAGWRTVFLSHDSHLPFGEKIFQQSRLRFSRPHVALVNRRVRRLARACSPDLVFISGSNWYVSPDTIRWLQRGGARVVLNEQHLQVFRSWQAACLPLYDHVFVQDGGLAALLRAAAPVRGASLLGPACDPREHRPVELSGERRRALGADVAYLGYAYANRLAMMEALHDFDVRLWGVGWDASPVLAPRVRREPVHGLKKTQVYNATAVNLNLQSHSYQLDGVTCRPFEVAACGAFCLTEPRRDLATFFRPGEEMVTFDGLEDLRGKIRHYLAHPDERREIAARARARALGEHTYGHRVQQVLSTVGL